MRIRNEWNRLLCIATVLTISASIAYADDGAAAFTAGNFSQAAAAFAKEAQSLHGPARAAVLTRLAAAQQEMGDYEASIVTLNDAAKLAPAQSALAADIQIGLGAGYTALRQSEAAETNLNAALKSARDANDHAAEGRALLGLANLQSANAKPQEAKDSFAAAEKVGDENVAASALAGQAHIAPTTETNQRAAEAARKLPSSHAKVFLLLSAGRIDKQLLSSTPTDRAALLQSASDAFTSARTIAHDIGDTRGESYAAGCLGELYERDGRRGDALALSRQAVFLAQASQSPDALYTFQWQVARLLHSAGDNDGAILAYHQAIETLQSIRHDLALGYGAPETDPAGNPPSFRSTAGAIYFERADLLLRRTETLKDPAEIQQGLREARDTVELLKSAELEDYFQDECVNVLKSKSRGIEALSPTTAVLYIIPLKDHTELLLGFNDGLQRFVAPVSEAALTEEARKFRSNLEDRASNRYITQAKHLYAWLIAPAEQELAARKIDTLVFVPDGALRTIPMGALHDDKEFLIQKYAVAVTPGLTLTEPRPLSRNRKDVRVLANGLSESRQGFAPLEYVPAELSEIERLYGGQELLNQNFRVDRLTEEVKDQPYSIVHIASHGQFRSNAADTFLLAYDGKVDLRRLEQIIHPSQFRGQPVELLTLSACQTAAGDDRAALGLAGVAVKAGARSALATLWYVNDQASSDLVMEFYAQLRADPPLSKAQALRNAQCKLIATVNHHHPCYWSPYLLIGNWL